MFFTLETNEQLNEERNLTEHNLLELLEVPEVLANNTAFKEEFSSFIGILLGSICHSKDVRKSAKVKVDGETGSISFVTHAKDGTEIKHQIIKEDSTTFTFVTHPATITIHQFDQRREHIDQTRYHVYKDTITRDSLFRNKKEVTKVRDEYNRDFHYQLSQRIFPHDNAFDAYVETDTFLRGPFDPDILISRSTDNVSQELEHAIMQAPFGSSYYDLSEMVEDVDTIPYPISHEQYEIAQNAINNGDSETLQDVLEQAKEEKTTRKQNSGIRGAIKKLGGLTHKKRT